MNDSLINGSLNDGILFQEVLLAPDIQEHLRHAKTTSNPEGTVQVESSGGTKDDMGNETPLSANSIKNLIELSSPGDEKEAQYTLTQSTKKMKLPTTPQGNSTDSHPSKKLITRKTAGEMLFAAECKLRKQRKKISTEAVSRLDTANSGGKKTRHSEVDGNKPSAVDATEVVSESFLVVLSLLVQVLHAFFLSSFFFS